MKMTYLLRLLMVVGIVLPGWAQLHAERIFLSFDQTCIDRMQYSLVSSGKTTPYFVYHINIRPGEKIALSVGYEDDNRGEQLNPGDLLTCANAAFDEQFVNRINTNADEVFIATRRSNGSYRVSKVYAASHYRKNGTVVSYASSLYRFQFDMRTVNPGALVNWGNMPGTNVYFDELRDHSCSKVYVFSQLAQQGTIPFMRIVFIPEIGVVEESAGTNPTDANNTRLSLKLVGDKQASQFLAANCGKEPGAHSPLLTNYAPQPTVYDNAYPAADYQQTPALSAGQDLQPRGAVQQPAQTYPPAYSSSTARDAQPAAAPQQAPAQSYPPAYNRVTTRSAQPAAAPQQAPAQSYPPAYSSTTAAGTQPAAAPQQAPAQTYPPAYSSTTARGTQPAQQGWQAQAPTATSPSNQAYPPANQYLFHTVQHGETMFQIARRYSMNIDQLYADNNLNSSSIIYAGQQIRVRQQATTQTTATDLTARSVAIPTPQTAATPTGWNGNTAAAAQPAVNTAMPTPTNAPAWRTTNGWHTFAAGETVATVASRYGYTEARFRDMNGLAPTDFPRIGQQLRTLDNPAAVANDNQLTPRGVPTGSTYPAAAPMPSPASTTPSASTPASYLPRPYQPNVNDNVPAAAPATRPQTPVLGSPRPAGGQLPANGYDWQ